MNKKARANSIKIALLLSISLFVLFIPELIGAFTLGSDTFDYRNNITLKPTQKMLFSINGTDGLGLYGWSGQGNIGLYSNDTDYNVSMLSNDSSEFFMVNTNLMTITGTPDSDLIFFYPFDNNLTIAKDYVNNYNSTTTTGNPHMENDGVFGKSAYFDGNDEFSIVNSTDTYIEFDLNNDWSIGFWMKTNSSTATQFFIRGTVILNDRIMLMLDGGNQRFLVEGGDEKMSVTSTGEDINDGEWHHIVATYQVSTDNIYLYIDGTLNDSDETDMSNTFDNISEWTIGNDPSDDYPFTGYIDNLFAIKKLLNSSEVEEIYNNSLNTNMMLDTQENSSGAGNTAPTLLVYDTSPDSPTELQNITFNITCVDSDSGDTLTGYLEIHNGTNSHLNYSTTLTNNTNKLLATVSGITVGEVWNGTFWCGDGTVNTSKSIDSVTVVAISNTPYYTLNSPTDGQNFSNDTVLVTLNLSIFDVNSDACNVTFYDNTTINAGKWNISRLIDDGEDVSINDAVVSDVIFKPDGSDFYISGDDDNKIYQFKCTTAWNLSTCSAETSIASIGAQPTGIFFKPDGLKLYQSDKGDDALYESNCTTAWNLSTCTKTGINITISDITPASVPNDVIFKPDGTKFYVQYNYYTFEYLCTDAWNLSSCSSGNNITGAQANCQDIAFKPDGLKFYQVCANLNSTAQFECSDAWNLTSCTYDSSIATPRFSGMYMKNDSTTVYFSSSYTNKVHQYSFNTSSNIINETQINVANGSDATVPLTVSKNTTYNWYATIFDGTNTNTTDVFTFSVNATGSSGNNDPNTPIINFPTNGQDYTNGITYVEFNITYSDPDGDTGMLRLFNNDTGLQIDNATGLSNDSESILNWTGMSAGTYYYYIQAEDNNSQTTNSVVQNLTINATPSESGGWNLSYDYRNNITLKPTQKMLFSINGTDGLGLYGWSGQGNIGLYSNDTDYNVSMLSNDSSEFFMVNTNLMTITGTPDSDLIFFYPFDNNLTIAKDYVNNYNSTTTTGNPHMENDGVFGKSAYFDGNDEFSIVNSTDTYIEFDLNNDWSIGFWMKTNSSTATQFFIRGTVILNDRIMLMLDGGNQRFLVEGGDEKMSVTSTGEDINDGEWHHIVATYQVSTDNIYLYIDGTLNDSDETDMSNTFDNISEWTIGNDPSDDYPFTGYIDNLFAIKKLLNSSEVEEIYNNSLNTNMMLDTQEEKSISQNNSTVFTLNNPTDGQNFSSATTQVNLNVTTYDSNSATLNITFRNATNDGVICTENDVTNNTASDCNWTGLNEGTKSFYINTIDVNGESTNSSTWTFGINATINNTPTISILSPANNTDYLSNTIYVEVSFNISDTDVMNFTCLWGNGSEVQNNESVASGTHTIICNYTGLTLNHNYTLFGNVTDGNTWNTTGIYTIIINDTIQYTPTYSTPQPTSGTTYASGKENITLNITVFDRNNDTLNITFWGREVSGVADNFTFMIMPDFQRCTSSGKDAWCMNITQFINDSVDEWNTIMGLNVGDFTEYNSIDNWEDVKSYMERLESVPWAGVAGNHDIGNDPPFDWVNYDTYLPLSNFSEMDYFLGSNSSDSRYTSWSIPASVAGGDDYLILMLPNIGQTSFEWEHEWINETLTNNSDKRVIIVTHQLMVAAASNDYTAGGQYINTTTLQNFDNIDFVLSGHYYTDKANRTNSAGTNSWYEIQKNYQWGSGPTGDNDYRSYMAIMKFVPNENKVYAYTYSPYLDVYNTSALNQFTLDYNMTGESTFSIIGTDTNVANGSVATIDWTNRSDNKTYEWYVVIDDGTLSNTTETYNFTINDTVNTSVSLDCWFDPVYQEPTLTGSNLRDVWCNLTHANGTPILNANISHSTYDTNDWYKNSRMDSKGWYIGYQSIPNAYNQSLIDINISRSRIIHKNNRVMLKYGAFTYPFQHINQTFSVMVKAGDDASLLQVRVCNNTAQELVMENTPVYTPKFNAQDYCSSTTITVNKTTAGVNAENWTWVDFDITEIYNNITASMSGVNSYTILIGSADNVSISPVGWSIDTQWLPPLHNETLEAYSLENSSDGFYTIDEDGYVHAGYDTLTGINTSGILRHYHLDSLSDVSGNADTLTNNDDASLNSSGLFNYSYEFDGNDNLDTTYKPSNDSKAMIYWVKYTTLSGGAQLIGVHDNSNHRFYAGIDSSGLNFYGCGDSYIHGSNLGLTVDTWYMISTSMNGSECIYYLNGEEQTSISYSQTGTSSDNYSIGAPSEDGWGQSRGVHGQLDEVLIYNREVSSDEMMDLYLHGREKLKPSNTTHNISTFIATNNYLLPSESVTFDATSKYPIFDSNDDVLEPQNISNWQSIGGTNTSMTLCYFIKRNDTSTAYRRIEKWDDATTSGAMSFYVRNNDITFWIREVAESGCGYRRVNTAGDLVGDTDWHHVCGVVDREEGELRVIVDGETAGTTSINDYCKIRPVTEVVIGRDSTSSGSDQGFIGQLAQVFLHNGAHSDAEIFNGINTAWWSIAIDNQETSNVYAIGEIHNTTSVYWSEEPTHTPISYIKIYNMNNETAYMEYNSSEELYHYTYYTSEPQFLTSQGANGVNFTTLFKYNSTLNDTKYWYIRGASNSSCTINSYGWVNSTKTGQYQHWYVNWSVSSTIPVNSKGLEICSPSGICYSYNTEGYLSTENSPSEISNSEIGNYSFYCYSQNDFDTEQRNSTEQKHEIGCWRAYNDYNGSKESLELVSNLHICSGTHELIAQESSGAIYTKGYNISSNGSVILDGGDVRYPTASLRTKMLWIYDMKYNDFDGSNFTFQNGDLAICVNGNLTNSTIYDATFINMSTGICIKDTTTTENVNIVNNQWINSGIGGKSLIGIKSGSVNVYHNNFSTASDSLYNIKCSDDCDGVTLEQNYYSDISSLAIYSNGTNRTVNTTVGSYTCEIGVSGSQYPYSNYTTGENGTNTTYVNQANLYGQIKDEYPCTTKDELNVAPIITANNPIDGATATALNPLLNATITDTNGDDSNITLYSYCYQESANESNQTGIDGSCSLEYNGTYTLETEWSGEIDTTDGNWSTWNSVSMSDGDLYINYSIPENVTGSIYKYKYFTQAEGEITKYTVLPSGCFNSSKGIVEFWIYHGLPALGEFDNSTVKCKLNSGSWSQISESPWDRFYEEAIYWKIQSNTSTNSASGSNILYQTDHTYNGNMYFWSVNASDGTNSTEELFNFTTGYEPIVSGNLLIPTNPEYSNESFLQIIVSDTDGVTTVNECNFTVMGANGTAIFSNSNGTRLSDNSTWNSTSFNMSYGYGQYNFSATCSDGSFTDTLEWNYTLTQGTINYTPYGTWINTIQAGNTTIRNYTIAIIGENSRNILYYLNMEGMINNNFTLAYSNNLTILVNGTDSVRINLTANNTLTTGSYSGNITFNRTTDGVILRLPINITIANATASLTPTPASKSYSMDASTVGAWSVSITNSGNWNATDCNSTITGTVAAFSTISNKNFTVLIGDSTSFNVIHTNPSSGSYSGTLTVSCIGSDNNDTVTTLVNPISLTVSTPSSPPSGGGGGGGSPVVKRDCDITLPNTLYFEKGNNVRKLNIENNDNETFLPSISVLSPTNTSLIDARTKVQPIGTVTSILPSQTLELSVVADFTGIEDLAGARIKIYSDTCNDMVIPVILDPTGTYSPPVDSPFENLEIAEDIKEFVETPVAEIGDYTINLGHIGLLVFLLTLFVSLILFNKTKKAKGLKILFTICIVTLLSMFIIYIFVK